MTPGPASDRVAGLRRSAAKAFAAGRPADAARALSEACEIAPWRDDLAVELAGALDQAGRPELALRAYELAAEIGPPSLDALLGAGRLLRRHHRYAAALEWFRRAEAAAPDDFEPVLAAARALADQGRTEAARVGFERALALGAPASLRWLKATLLPVVNASRREIVEARRRLWEELDILAADPPAIDDPLAETDGAPFLLAYHGEEDRPLMERLAALYRRSCPALTWTAPHCHGPRRPGPRRIAVVSHYLHAHSVGRYFVRLIEGLTAAGAQVHLFTPPAADDDIRRRYVGAARSVEATGADLWAARDAIAAAAPDVVLFIDQGFNPLTYFLAFARLAPVQCTVLGHPVTAGLHSIDHFLSCDAAEPPGAEASYTERLVRLPGQPTAYVRPSAPASRSRASFGLPAGGRLYLMAQNLFKLHPDMDEPLARILAEDTEGQLAVVAGHDPAWTEEAVGRLAGGAGERVAVVPRLSHGDFLSLLAAADVCLDSFHFSGANTTYQALAVGTPVVTLPGAFVRGRQSLAILQACGLGELVAADADDYVRKSIAAARDPGLRERVQEFADRLFDDDAHLAAAVDFLMAVDEPAAR